jgi:DNA-binding HxlR family transcriptional regulator
LGRLEHLGLIHRIASSSTKGEPNAWQLTPRGLQLERTIHPHTNNTTP